MNKEKIIKILAIACIFIAGFFFTLGFNKEDGGDSFEILSSSEESAYTVEETTQDVELTKALETSETSDGLVNINTASATELKTLPGIGTVRAQAIIDYRESNGAFASKTDIMKVSGIKEASYEKIKDLIKVE